VAAYGFVAFGMALFPQILSLLYPRFTQFRGTFSLALPAIGVTALFAAAVLKGHARRIVELEKRLSGDAGSRGEANER
jgi:hypothetical protein